MFRNLTIFGILVGLTTANLIIESPHETDWGEWQTWDRCPVGNFAQALQLKTEPYGGVAGDDTAANAVRFYCGNPSNISTSIITSGQGIWGQYGKVFSCRSDGTTQAPDGFITGFQLRVESNQGPLDDTATNSIRIFCNYPGLPIAEQMIEADGLGYGQWTTAQKCEANQAICGVQTQVEGNLGAGDDTALNNVAAECCDR